MPAMILTLCVAAAVLHIFCQRYDPQRPHARMLRMGVTGLMMLLAWNLLPLPHVGVNPLSAMLAGAWGLPGTALVAVLNLLP
jgi:hypothetical protein